VTHAPISRGSVATIGVLLRAVLVEKMPYRIKISYLRLLIAGVLGLPVAACDVQTYDEAAAAFGGGSAPSPPPAPPPEPPPAGASFGPNFSEIQSAVFTPTCATSGCHAGAGPAGSLDLTADASYAMLVGIASAASPGVLRVDPGDPDGSYLVQKLEGSAGTQMPPSGPALAQADIDVIRQWISDGASDDGATAPADPIRVTSLSPAPGAALEIAPAQIVAGFDRDLDESTVNSMTFMLRGSGGDGSFADGNEVNVTAASIGVPAGNTASAVLDLSGVDLTDDTYEIRLAGSGASMIQDIDANALDGEFSGTFPSGNGVAGGDFVATFTLTTPVMLGPTLEQIQAVVFTPNCASSSCHGGGVPAAGLNLEAGSSYASLVGMPSNQDAGMVRVVPFDADSSYLVMKLENDPAITGSRMPPSTPLAQSTIDVIREWINAGAEE
jgi:hypothetical protein